MMDADISLAIKAAQGGDKEALETVVNMAQGYIYNLALRMLQIPQDAEDATQEILIQLITRLGQFRGESAFTTWMYRVASNHLLNRVTRDREQNRLSFEGMSLRLEESLAYYEDSAEEAYENSELIEEVKRNCTLGMLRCLNGEDRLALILGEVLEFDGELCAEIMDITPTAFRKRLSRARQAIVTFTAGHCGIVNPNNPCRCHKHVRAKVQAGLLESAHLQYGQAHDSQSAFYAAQAEDATLDQTQRAIALIRAHPVYDPAVDYRQMINQIFSAGNEDR